MDTLHKGDDDDNDNNNNNNNNKENSNYVREPINYTTAGPRKLLELAGQLKLLLTKPSKNYF